MGVVRLLDVRYLMDIIDYDWTKATVEEDYLIDVCSNTEMPAHQNGSLPGRRKCFNAIGVKNGTTPAEFVYPRGR